MQLATAGLLIIYQRKLLLAFSKNKQCYYLPGGKINVGETAQEALCREIREELNVEVVTSDFQFYTHISAPAYGEPEGVVMEQDCFLLHTHVVPLPGAEVSELKYFTLETYLQEPRTAPGAEQILAQLQQDGLID